MLRGSRGNIIGIYKHDLEFNNAYLIDDSIGVLVVGPSLGSQRVNNAYVLLKTKELTGTMRFTAFVITTCATFPAHSLRMIWK